MYMPKFSQILASLEGDIITTSKKAAGIFSQTLTVIDNELKSDIAAIAPQAETAIITIIKDAIPVVWPLVTAGGNPTAIIAAGYGYFKDALPHLCEELWTMLAAELSLKVKDIATPAQVINEGVAAAVITPIPSA